MIRIEQLVYGTFSFTQGFTLVSTSEGIAGSTAHEIVEVCKSWGEILDPDFRSALFHVPVADSEPLQLVGKVVRQGTDRGDRMAWYQQVLAIPRADYLRTGADCFTYDEAGFFKDRWFESDRCTTLEVEDQVLPRFERATIGPLEIPRLAELARALAGGAELRASAGRSTRAIAALFRKLLNLLPADLRRRVSLTTFAFRPVRRYDLWCIHEAGGGVPSQAQEVRIRPERAGSAVWAAGIAEAERVRFVAIVAEGLRLLEEGKLTELDILLDNAGGRG